MPHSSRYPVWKISAEAGPASIPFLVELGFQLEFRRGDSCFFSFSQIPSDDFFTVNVNEGWLFLQMSLELGHEFRKLVLDRQIGSNATDFYSTVSNWAVSIFSLSGYRWA